MDNSERFKEEKARDNLAFDPLPKAAWLSINDTFLAISVSYSEKLSRLLRSLPGSRWDALNRRWQFPFSSAPEIRRCFDEIDQLAKDAHGRADQETERRRLEKAKREEKRREDVEQKRRSQSRQPAAMQQAYLTPASLSYFTLALEAIGAHPPKHLAPYQNSIRREWVAQIMGVDGRGRFVRAFLDGNRDYAGANAPGSRGVMTYFQLEHGPIYEVASPQTWRSTDRYFCRIENSTLIKMTEQEVMTCLAR